MILKELWYVCLVLILAAGRALQRPRWSFQAVRGVRM